MGSCPSGIGMVVMIQLPVLSLVHAAGGPTFMPMVYIGHDTTSLLDPISDWMVSITGLHQEYLDQIKWWESRARAYADVSEMYDGARKVLKGWV